MELGSGIEVRARVGIRIGIGVRAGVRVRLGLVGHEMPLAAEALQTPRRDDAHLVRGRVRMKVKATARLRVGSTVRTRLRVGLRP